MKALSTALAFALAASPALAADTLEGEPYIHDPSTVTFSDGAWYTFGTGAGGLVSTDGWTWHRGGERPGGGVAPDVIHLGDRYYVAYAVGGGGMNGGHASNIKVMWTHSLDPKSPQFGYHEVGTVASSDGHENCDAIDPAFLYVNGHLWLSYGTYFGYIRMVELDPATGARLPGNNPVDIAIDLEATALLYRDGWYYLLGTQGTCCEGPNSTYNIRVGRSRDPLGPYLDDFGVPMLKGGGKLVWGAHDRHYGAGHFGLITLDDAVQKFSFHYESDMDRTGRSTLAINPLVWRDGWPVGMPDAMPGTYQIRSARGVALELAIDAPRMPFDWRRSGFMAPEGPPEPLPDQTFAENSAVWPQGPIAVDMGLYMVRPHQRWTITPVAGAGGYFGAPYVKITIEGTARALAATPQGEIVTVPQFTGAPEQLWRLDRLTDGSFRIAARTSPDPRAPLVLTAVGRSTVRLAPFADRDASAHWDLEAR